MMRTTPATIYSIGPDLPTSEDQAVLIVWRPGAPEERTGVELGDGHTLPVADLIPILEEAERRLRRHIAGLRAERAYAHYGLVGYLLDGAPFCLTCFYTCYEMGDDNAAYPRAQGAVVRQVAPIIRQQITCTMCGERYPWVLRVLEGGRS